MKLYSVVFTNKEVGNLKFVEKSNDPNSKYKSIYLENSLVSQRYFLSKELVRDIIKSRKDKSKETYPEIMKVNYSDATSNNEEGMKEPFLTEYEFDNIGAEIDSRNFNIILNKNGNDDYSILSIAIDDECYQLLDYEDGGKIFQTGKGNGFKACLISIPKIKNDSELSYVIGLTLGSVDDSDTIARYNIFVSSTGVSVYRYDMMYINPLAYINYINMVNGYDKFYKTFKLSNVTGINTDVVLINSKYITDTENGIVAPVIDNSEYIDHSRKFVLIPCTSDTINDEYVVNNLTEYVLNKNIRAITTIGVKLNPGFFREYKILYMYSYSPKTGISTCIKTN